EGRVEAAEGTHYLSYVEDVTGAGRLYGRDVRLLRVTNGDLAEVKHWRLGPESGWALAVRDEVAALMAQPASVDELLAERERLLARLAEIDAQLPEPAGVEVDTRAAAQALGVSVRTVQRWAATGKVAASKDAAGRWVITITISTNDA
ncbi:MAG TPA: helix-turn-helix domain-containing protein, partial [Micromonosporaceae bacterium]|nr:helix-turn-helix domain-containing protein [Micromonosporaceae bacterium]